MNSTHDENIKANYFNAYFFLFQGISSGETTSASTDTTTATSTAITTIGGDEVNSDIPTLGTTATTRHDRRESVPTILLLQTNTTFPNTTATDNPAVANTTSGNPDEATTSNDTTKETIATSGTTEEEGVTTIVGDHHHNGHEEDQEASTPVEEGLGSTGRMVNSSHPSSTGSTTTAPDVSRSCTSLKLGNLHPKTYTYLIMQYISLQLKKTEEINRQTIRHINYIHILKKNRRCVRVTFQVYCFFNVRSRGRIFTIISYGV